MRRLVEWPQLDKRVRLFLEVMDEFRGYQREGSLNSDELFALEWLDRHFSMGVLETNDLVRLQVSNKTWIPKANTLLLVTPNTGMTTGIVALFWAYVSGTERIRVRPGSGDLWIRKFVGMLNEKDSSVSLHGFGHLKMSELERELRPYDLVVLYGSRETIDKFKLSAPTRCEVVGYGPKMSIALHERDWWDLDLQLTVGYNFNKSEEEKAKEPEVLPKDSMSARYFKDITTYDGLGCLNTSILYTLHWNEAIQEGVKELASQLEEVAAKNPILVQNWQFQASVEPSFAEMWGTVVRRETQTVDLFLPIGFGTLQVVHIQSEEELLNEWKGREHLLSSATLWSGVDNRSHWTAVLAECGASRVAWTGEAQEPPLTWENDGVNPLRSLVRVMTEDDDD